MEIPENVQNKMKCSECNELLSCGPVYLLHESGGAICGRCSQPSEEEDSSTTLLPMDSSKDSDRTRFEPYEAAASLLAFPCAFADRGCPDKIKFSVGQPPHELNCEFRPFICPIAPRGSCEWIGSWSKLEEHCNEQHTENILENPCNPPRPDFTTSNLQTYLISAFRFLFLLHIKVCVTTGKLFHSVKMFGDSEPFDKFSYTLEIEGNGLSVKKVGSVLRAGILMLQESTANCISINSLLDIFDGKYNESKFTIRIQSSVTLNCLNCLKDFVNVADTKFCDECQEKLIKCMFNEKSCSFVDVCSEKCSKHYLYFCEYQTICCDCKIGLAGRSFVEHLCSSTSHETIQSNIDSVVRFKPGSKSKYVIFSSNNIGTIICEYNLSNYTLTLYLRTSLPSYELKNYNCSIKLTDPYTEHTKISTPEIQYNCWDDWIIKIDISNFPIRNSMGIDMKINIEKI